ncbi:MAG: acyl carrier protein [Clostridiales bacterium]|nr:acyl carrier protein [Clostridiales bacterium]
MVFEKVAEMLAEKVDCDVSEIQAETKFADLGIDSLDITEMVMNVEDEFGIELGMDASLETVGALVEKIESIVDKK